MQPHFVNLAQGRFNGGKKGRAVVGTGTEPEV